MSWAVTIHKCQGMTLPKIVVDMCLSKGHFREGQAYVALSRVTSLDKLHIIKYSHQQIKVSSDVVKEMTCSNKKVLPEIVQPMILKCKGEGIIKISHINVANIRFKQQDIIRDEVLHSCDVICFNETHLSSDTDVDAYMFGFDNDYEMFQCDCNENGGGVMVLCKKKYFPIHCKFVTNLELILLKINFMRESMYILSVYRSFQNRLEKWGSDMNNILAMFDDGKMCIIGDMNEDILDDSKRHIYDMFCPNNCVQHISQPTRDSGTLIDHVYVTHWEFRDFSGFQVNWCFLWN